MKTVLILLGVTMLFSISVKSSALMKSPWNDDLGNLLTMIFDCENSIQNLKYDRKTEQWVEECPDIECEHGVDDGDQAMCPSCLLGPGESCSNWKGKCGDELKCRYSSAFESIGTCVLESEFNSRKEGESCGYYEGECGEGLKCQSDVDILSYFCGMDEAGVCVKKEQFSSRKEGESCGDKVGECQKGLECVASDHSWFSFVCKNLTNNDSSNHNGFGDGIFFEEIIEESVSENGEPEEHVQIKVINNNGDSLDKHAVEEIVNSELDSLLGSDLEQKKQIMDEINASKIGEQNSVSTHITHKGKLGDKQETITIDIEEKKPDVENDIIFIDSEVSDAEEKSLLNTFETDQPSIEIL